jgi:hypothetical protein
MKLRTDKLEPPLKKSNTETADPMRAYARKLKLLPKWRKSIMDEPDPILQNERKLKLLPNSLAPPPTERWVPATRMHPAAEKLLPNRANDLIDMLLPPCANSKADTQEPKRMKLRTETLLPSAT